MDKSILAANIAKAKNPRTSRSSARCSRRADRLHAAQDDPAFKKAVDDSIKRQIKRTARWPRLYDKWFMQPIPPNVNLKMPMSDAAPRQPGPTQRQTDGRLRQEVKGSCSMVSPGRPCIGARGVFLHIIYKGLSMSWDWQVFCEDTITREATQSCFAQG